jgi:hypothetical protein
MLLPNDPRWSPFSQEDGVDDEEDDMISDVLERTVLDVIGKSVFGPVWIILGTFKSLAFSFLAFRSCTDTRSAKRQYVVRAAVYIM